jgi:hypothetical protein
VSTSTPEPRSALLTLEPMRWPTMLEAAIRFLRRQPGTLLTVGAIAGFAGAGANLIGLGTVYPHLQEQLTALEPLAADPQGANQQQLAAALAQLLSSTAALFVLILVISLPVYAIVNGLLIAVLGRDIFGDRTSTGQAWQMVRRKVGGLLGQVLMAMVLLSVCGLPVVVALSMARRDPVVGVGLAMLMAPLCLVAMVLLLPRLLLAPVCLVLEDIGVAESFVRARHLARGQVLRVLGITAAAVLITRVVAAVVGLPFDLFAGADPLTTQGVFMSSLGRVAGTAVSLPILSAMVALVYVDLRVRKEGLGRSTG